MQLEKKELLSCLDQEDLLRAGVLTGRIEDPTYEYEPLQEQLVDIADRVAQLCEGHRRDSMFCATAITKVLFEEYGLKGRSEKYRKVIDDPRQYYLHHVLKQKTGSPLTIMMLYFIISDQIGLATECISVVGNYFLKVLDDDTPFYIHPFENGMILSEAAFRRRFKQTFQKNKMMTASVFEKLSRDQLMGKFIQRFKHIYILKNDAIHALRAVELLTALYPKSPELTRDRGILYCEMEYFSKAIHDLRFYIKSRPQAEDIKDIRKLHRMLQGYSETLN